MSTLNNYKMKTEIKDQSGKVLFTAEVEGKKININDESGKKFCCIEHDGSKLKVKDAEENVLKEEAKE